MTSSNYHIPVMLNECIEALNIKEDGIYVDVTFGGGGHSKAILNKLGKKGKLVAFDQDEDAKKNLPNDERLIFIDQNFSFLENHLHYQGLLPVNGILADLGVSSFQFDTASKGFSFRFDDSLLDMRMNKNQAISAAHILNNYTSNQLADIFYYYGELKNSRQLAASIEHYRLVQPIETIAHLKEAVKNQTPKYNDYKFFAQLFQALRIEVNNELEVLKQLLTQSASVLDKKGRLVVMSYHSLEDRLVKNFINTGNFKGEAEKDFYGNILKPFEPVNKHIITANDKEVDKNPRARSAKLRVAQKI
ncbi:MAG: 16S rRNA (cytosine(1402)-N(4))-methyltransferase RsmH [Bacteroidia bacterium]